MAEKIHFKLNGKPTTLKPQENQTLLWALRVDLGFTGTKYGCGRGLCGACTVLVNDEAVRSCRFPAKDLQGKEVTTIEGLAKGDVLHPLQKAFVDHDALQCGYCTPGMIMNAHALLAKNPNPTTAQIAEGMEINLCRCGAHTRIVQAIEAVSKNQSGSA